MESRIRKIKEDKSLRLKAKVNKNVNLRIYERN